MFKLTVVFALYVAVSALLFPLVYEASPEVIDEQFHLRQGLAYCNGDFDTVSRCQKHHFHRTFFIRALHRPRQWDPKITTFPGLYIVSTVLNYPLATCSAWTMRLTSLLASVANVWLIYQIRRTVLHTSGAKTRALANLELETLAIALLPPMYFFAHLYYTDVLSLSTVLALMLYNMRHQHNVAALFGESCGAHPT